MWIEELSNGKYKYFERYKDPYTEKWRKVSVTLESASNRAKKEAQKILEEKIKTALRNLKTSDAYFTDVLDSWWEFHKKEIRRTSISALTSNVRLVRETFGLKTKITKIDTLYVQDYINKLDISRPKLERVKSILNLCFL